MENITILLQQLDVQNVTIVATNAPFVQRDHIRLQYIYLGVSFLSIEIIILLPILFGNLLILISIAKFKRLRSRMNILIANLAVSDFLVGAVMIPYDISFLLTPSLRERRYTCLLRHAFETAFLGSSVMNLLVISLERYIAIVHPLKHVANSSTKWLISLIASSWTISLLIASFPLMGWNSWYPGAPCDPSYIYEKSYKGLLYTVLIGSVCSNFVMFVKVVRTAFSQLKAIQSSTSDLADELKMHQINTKTKSIKKTKMMILVLGTFAVCWGPNCIAAVFETIFLEPSDNLELVKKFLACFGLLNSGLNWIIFGLKNKTYRKAFKYILCCGKDISDSSLMVSSSAK